MKYTLSPDYSMRKVLDECVIVPIRAEEDGKTRFYNINPTGKIVLDGLGDGKSLVEISNEIADKYEVEIEKAQQDVVSFITEFLTIGIIVAQE